MPAFLPEAPLISQELVSPIISHFALLAENSANVPKRLCFLVLGEKKKKTPKTKPRKTAPKKKNNKKETAPALAISILFSLGEQKHPRTTGLQLVIKPS